MKRVPALLCIVVFATCAVFAQRTVDEETIKTLQQRSVAFVGLVYQGDYAEAFDFVRGYPRAISNENLDELEVRAAKQLEEIQNAFGEKLEAQYIGFNALSDFLLRFIYVVRYELHFVWWQIVYYRGAEDTWLCSTISYDIDQDALMNLTF